MQIDRPPAALLDATRRRRIEVAFWAVLLSVQALFNAAGSFADLHRVGRPVPAWEPLLWELSSAAAIALLLPLVFAFERRYPVEWSTLGRNLPRHLAASVVFCALHVGLMVALRALAYGTLGQPYAPGPWHQVLAYEFLKDVRTYVLLLAAAVSWRLLLLRWQGEARLLDAAEPVATLAASGAPAPPSPAAAATVRPERFLVRKLRSEFLIAAADIASIQAQGNYVSLHVNGHDYLLRSTLTQFLAQLDPARFARVHRSWAVNLDAVAEIVPLDDGDARLRLSDGSTLPCSRSYRGSALPRTGAMG